MRSSISDVLSGARSADLETRRRAEAALEQASSNDLVGLLTCLCEELTKPTDNRQIAGLVLKNTLVGKSEGGGVMSRWQLIDQNERVKIRQAVLMVMGSQFPDARKVAALIVAKIAGIELPHGQWQDLVPLLINSMTTGNSDLWESTFTCIRYICEESAQSQGLKEALKMHAKDILSVVKEGVDGKFSQSVVVQSSAIKALQHTLDIVDDFFQNERFRTVIIKEMICKMCQHQNPSIRLDSYLCMCELASYYYEYLSPYMEQLFQLTSHGMTQDEEIAKQSTEFWSIICEIEMELKEQQEMNPNNPSNRTNFNYIPTACKVLTPVLLQNISKQDENIDPDEWTVSKAAAICLTLTAELVKKDILPLVLPFIEQNINLQDWKQREAAILVFGLVLSGPEPSVLLPLAKEICPVVVQNLQHSNHQVKDTAVWTLGRMFKQVPNVLNEPQRLEQMIRILVQCLHEDKAQIAFHVCWALSNIAEQTESNQQTTPLSKYLQPLILSLLQRADKPDALEHNLLNSCYETINELIKHSGVQDQALIADLLTELVKRMKNELGKPATSQTELRRNNTLANLCSAIGTVVMKIPNELLRSAEGLSRVDLIMELFIVAMQEKDSIIQEEVFMAIGPIVSALEEQFQRYVSNDMFMKLMLNGLENAHEQPMLCKVAVGLLGDVARTCPSCIKPQCDAIVQLLLQCLTERRLLVTVKPDIIACFADIALAIGEDIYRYFKHIMHLLLQAGSTTTENLDPDVIETVYRMRVAILEAFCAILHGLKDGHKQVIFLQHTEPCIKFMKLILEDNPSSVCGPNEEILTESLHFVIDFIKSTAQGSTHQRELTKRLRGEECILELVHRCQSIPSCREGLERLKRLVE